MIKMYCDHCQKECTDEKVWTLSVNVGDHIDSILLCDRCTYDFYNFFGKTPPKETIGDTIRRIFCTPPYPLDPPM